MSGVTPVLLFGLFHFMTELDEIKFVERVFFEIQRIKRDLEALEDFISARMKDDAVDQPKTDGMMDPRTGEKFKP